MMVRPNCLTLPAAWSAQTYMLAHNAMDAIRIAEAALRASFADYGQRDRAGFGVPVMTRVSHVGGLPGG